MSTDEVFTVKSIFRHKIIDGQCKFLIRWENYVKATWEDVSKLTQCPLLLQEFQLRERARYRKRHAVNGGQGEGFLNRWCEPLPTADSRRFRHRAATHELVGNEELVKIHRQEKHANRTGKETVLWWVRLAGFDTEQLIHREAVIFYFPVESCLFMQKIEAFEASYTND